MVTSRMTAWPSSTRKPLEASSTCTVGSTDTTSESSARAVVPRWMVTVALTCASPSWNDPVVAGTVIENDRIDLMQVSGLALAFVVAPAGRERQTEHEDQQHADSPLAHVTPPSVGIEEGGS